MDITFYRVMHIAAVIILFFAFGGLIQGAWSAQSRIFAHKRIFVLLHGIGLLLILVSGMGQLARLQGHGAGFPLWVSIKLALWFLLGVILTLILRKPHLNRFIWPACLVIGFCAICLAVFKPV